MDSRIPYRRFAYPLRQWMLSYEEPSLYDQRMKRLSCKIFNEYYEKPMPRSIARSADQSGKVDWASKWIQDHNLVSRLSTPPFDLDDSRNEKYFPAHPQMEKLTYTLREYGLYRDEHLDFKEEMKRLSELRGKSFRKLGGGGGKRR